MYPVAKWNEYGRGYLFKQPTFYSSAHLGLDVSTPTGTPVYAPFAGSVRINSFPEGGNVLEFSANGLIHRAMHLQKIVKTGSVNEGDLIAYTGNTGTLSTSPHIHWDISKGSVQVNNINNFIDPETFSWGEKEEEMAISPEQATLNNDYNTRLVTLDQRTLATYNNVAKLNTSVTNLTKALADNNAIDATQATQLVKALKDSQDALNKPTGGTTLSTEDTATISWGTKLRNLLNIK